MVVKGLLMKEVEVGAEVLVKGVEGRLLGKEVEMGLVQELVVK